MIRALFIDDAFLESNFPVPSGIEKKAVLPAIKIAQSTSLYDILGSCLYDYIEQGVIDEDLTGEELTLFQLCQMFLVYETSRNLIDFNNTGVKLDAMTRNESGSYNRSQGVKTERMLSNISEKADYFRLRIKRLINSTADLKTIATADGCTDIDAYNPNSDNTNGLFYPYGIKTEDEC